MDSLDWELTQLCRRIETNQRKAREEKQGFEAVSPEEQLRRGSLELKKDYRGNKRQLERMNSIPLDRLSQLDLEKAVSLTINMALLDIVGTEGTRGLLRIRKYCGDDLILKRLVEVFEEMFTYGKWTTRCKGQRAATRHLSVALLLAYQALSTSVYSTA
jgi:hypothetical protein